MIRTLTRNLAQRRLSTLSYNIAQIPNISISEVASHLSDLGPYPVHSPYLNPQHYYQNTVLQTWSQKTPHPVTLMHLAQYGRSLTKQKIIMSANFVRLELPIRIARKLIELQELPFEVVNNFHLAKVYESYYDIFETFRKFPEVKSIEDNDAFCAMLENVLTDVNLLNLPNLMMGALECSILSSLPRNQLDELISSLLRARISRRLIIEEHLSLTKNYQDKKTHSISKDQKTHNEIGDIFFKCSARDHLEITAQNASKFTENLYPGLKMPELVIEGNSDLQFQFLTPHLHFMLGEILRNSYEATMAHFVSHNPNHKTDQPPPVSVCLIDNKDHVAFRFSDRGGGVPIEPIGKVWSFAKDPTLARASLGNFHKMALCTQPQTSQADHVTQARESLMNTSVGGIDDNYMKEKTLINLIQRPAESKLGLGLAMCKVYADYWNGDVVLHSMKGYGTDTYLKLGKLGYYNDKLQLDRA